MNTTEKYAIIGAGPSGLAIAKELKARGIAFDGFELGNTVGGLWDMNSPRSAVYPSAHLISSKTKTEFLDFPMPAHYPDYPNHKQVLQYFQDYANHFKITEHYRFGVAVQRLEPVEQGKQWQVQLSTGESYIYKGVFIAVGTHSEPNLPTIAGNFSGEIMHTAAYKSADIFKNKRVLIVGAGNSGCDIVVDAVHQAQSVDMSVRRGYYFVPKYMFGVPSDTLNGKFPMPRALKQWIESRILRWFSGDPSRFGFPKPDYKMYEVHPIINTLILTHLGQGDIKIRPDVEQFDNQEVVFKDGSRQTYDLVMYATGFKLHFPFIDKSHLNWQHTAPELFLNIFPPQYDNLFVMGMLEASGIGWEGRAEQARLVANFVKGLEQKTTQALHFQQLKKGKSPDMSGGFNYNRKLLRMSYYVHRETYRKLLRKYAQQLQ